MEIQEIDNNNFNDIMKKNEFIILQVYEKKDFLYTLSSVLIKKLSNTLDKKIKFYRIEQKNINSNEIGVKIDGMLPILFIHNCKIKSFLPCFCSVEMFREKINNLI